MTATTFDYRAAWEDCAAPAFAQLSPAVIAAYHAVHVRSANLKQGPTLAIPIPPDLRRILDDLTTRELAEGACVLFHYEHWGRGGGTGAGWKFANMADQILAQRLGLRSRFERDGGNGHGLVIIEGRLRATYSTGRSHPDGECWTWQELGLADSPEAVAEAAACAGPVRLAEWRAVSREVCKLQTARLPEPLRGLLQAVERYTVEKGKQRHDCKECGTEPLWGKPSLDHAPSCSHYVAPPHTCECKKCGKVLP